MKTIQKRMLLQIVLGFLVGRVEFMGLNPIGIAYFAAGFSQDGAKLPVMISVLLGMSTVLPVETVFGYGLVMFSLFLARDIARKRESVLDRQTVTWTVSCVDAVLALLRIQLMPAVSMLPFYMAAEVITVFVCTGILWEGVHFLLCHRRKRSVESEELISIVLLSGFSLLGVPDVVIFGISIMEVLLHLFVLAGGYCYGAGIGAVIGAVSGSILTIQGQDSAVMGMLTLLGICSGMLKEQGKVCLLWGYFAAGAGLSYLVSDTLPDSGFFVSILLAQAVFFIIPDKWLKRISKRMANEDASAKKIQEMLRYKLLDFAKSFSKLSGSLSKEREETCLTKGREARRMIEEMAGRVCSRCENRECCRGKISLRKTEMYGILALAQESGALALEQMPEEFMKECIHKERFITEANQSIHVANLIAGFQNRMAENQQVMAEQMREVGRIVEDLAEHLPREREIPDRTKRIIGNELRKRRILLSEMTFLEKCDGRLEVILHARTGRGRFVTTREVGELLSEILECRLEPKQECRTVLSREEGTYAFLQRGKLLARTGVGRIPKAGEEISGDTFSCTTLAGGECMLALSDGMGSGSDAYEESFQVIELLEEMMEAGFSEETAIRFINTVYLTGEEYGSFATADMAVINPYLEECHFLKCGASAGYLYHEGEIFKIEGQALPIGVKKDARPYLRKCSVSAGDYVIMMTDGVSDCFREEEHEIEAVIQLCLKNSMTPEGLANEILKVAMSNRNDNPDDDMSILVAKLYDVS